MTEEVKEVKEEDIKEEDIAKVEDNVGGDVNVPKILESVKRSASAFITDEDTFDLKVRYYVRGIKYCVENIDDNFDKEDVTDEFTFVCRIPNQEDVNIISQRVGSSGGGGEMTMFKAFTDMEYIRLVRLLKDWSLDEPCIESSIERMHPGIVKGMIVAVRNKLEMTAIV